MPDLRKMYTNGFYFHILMYASIKKLRLLVTYNYIHKLEMVFVTNVSRYKRRNINSLKNPN